MNVLILEDANIGGLTLRALNDRGMRGSWFICVKSVDSESLTGIRADRTVETVQLSQYNLALVDGFLMIDGLMGWDVLPWLKPLMFTVGTSSIGDIGANLEIDKAEMVDKLDFLIESVQSAKLLAAA